MVSQSPLIKVICLTLILLYGMMRRTNHLLSRIDLASETSHVNMVQRDAGAGNSGPGAQRKTWGSRPGPRSIPQDNFPLGCLASKLSSPSPPAGVEVRYYTATPHTHMHALTYSYTHYTAVDVRCYTATCLLTFSLSFPKSPLGFLRCSSGFLRF